MVTVKHFDDDYCLLKLSASSEASKNHCSRLGSKVPIYQFGSQSALDYRSCGGPVFSTKDYQSLLDSLFLGQWEDRAWTGFLAYDVTACELKVVEGRLQFVTQLNEEWISSHFSELDEVKGLHRLDPSSFDLIKTQGKELLFYIQTGEKASPELIQSATVPFDANLAIIINAKPVEYGHVFLVPSGSFSHLQFLDARLLEMVAQVAVETHNCSFHIICDCSTPSSDHMVFQACYFANPLPVELMPVVTVSSKGRKSGIYIYEVSDYPIKALLFKANENLKWLVKMIAEICSCLQKQNIPYSLLLSDCSTKIFLFPQTQVNMLESAGNVSAWECGGYFVFRSRDEFDGATEESLMKRLAAVSLGEEGFEALKQLCCSVAGKFVS